MLDKYMNYVKEETLSIDVIKDEKLDKNIIINDLMMGLKVERRKNRL